MKLDDIRHSPAARIIQHDIARIYGVPRQHLYDSMSAIGQCLGVVAALKQNHQTAVA
ncbi:MAG: hypothetical protein U5K56_00310 [Halioglobus sp.]|nr:hypothetical protein [Halioglobus sp.]